MGIQASFSPEPPTRPSKMGIRKDLNKEEKRTQIEKMKSVKKLEKTMSRNRKKKGQLQEISVEK